MQNLKKGFTLIELLVATSLFVIITTSLITALSIFLLYNLSLQDEQQALHSLGFASDIITREARLGIEFSCSAEMSGKCIELTILAPRFGSSDEIEDSYDKFCYKYDSGAERIERSVREISRREIEDNNDICDTTYIPITNPDLNITDAYFEIEADLLSQPNVELHITAEYEIDYLSSQQPQVIETIIGVTQRILKLPPDTSNYTTNIFVTSFSSFIYNDDLKEGGECVDESGNIISGSIDPCDTASLSILDITAGKRGLYILASNKRVFFLSNDAVESVIDRANTNAGTPEAVAGIQPTRIYGVADNRGYERNGSNDPKSIRKIYTDQRFNLVILEDDDGKLYSVSDTTNGERATLLTDTNSDLLPLNRLAIVAEDKLIATKDTALLEITYTSSSETITGDDITDQLDSGIDSGISPADIKDIISYNTPSQAGLDRLLFTMNAGGYGGHKKYRCFPDPENPSAIYTKEGITDLVQLIPFAKGRLLSEFYDSDEDYNHFSRNCQEPTPNNNHVSDSDSITLKAINLYSTIDLEGDPTLWVVNPDNKIYGIREPNTSNNIFNKSYDFAFGPTFLSNIKRLAPLEDNNLAVLVGQNLYVLKSRVTVFTQQGTPTTSAILPVEYELNPIDNTVASFKFNYLELKDSPPTP